MSVQSLVSRCVTGSISQSVRAVPPPRIVPIGLVIAFMGMLLSGCGGGSDDPTPSPTHQTLGVSVTGLGIGQSLVLQNNGADDFTVTANGSVRTAASWPLGSSYSVTVKSKPDAIGCVVRNGTGVIGAAPVDTVAVRCAISGSLADGFWEQDQCTPGPDGTGLKNGWNLSEGRPALVMLNAGTVSYRNTQCTGEGTLTMGPLAGTLTLIMMRREFGGDLSAIWASGEVLNPPTKPMVLVRKGNYLCLLDDTANPSAYPNAASTVSTVAAAIAAGLCYLPR